MRLKLLALLLLLFPASAVAAGLVVVQPTDTSVYVRYTIDGMGTKASCDEIVKTLAGATVTSHTTSTGLATRTVVLTGLTAFTSYTLTVQCTAQAYALQNYVFTTQPTPAGGNLTVPVSARAPASLTRVARVTLDYGTTTAVSSSVQNTSCGSGCITNASLPAGVGFFRLRWQDSGDKILYTSPVQTIVVGNSSVSEGEMGSSSGVDFGVPRLATWESNMTTYGTTTCNNFVAQGVNLGTYYDGLKSMELIRAYRVAKGDGDVSAWSACSDTANDVYRDGYVLAITEPGPGGTPGYNEFTGGFKIHYARTAEADSLKAACYLAGYHLCDSVGVGAAYCGLDYDDHTPQSPSRLRETAYCLNSILNYKAMGGSAQAPKRATVEQLVKDKITARIGTSSTAATYVPSLDAEGSCAGQYYWVQPFMLAIGAHALMLSYDDGGNQSEILTQIQWIGDWMLANSYVAASKSMWYDNCKASSLSDPWSFSRAGNPDLNMFFVDIYEWLYRHVCPLNPQYRTTADTLFDEGVRLGSGFLGYDGKHFNQNYAVGAFDYVAMRQLAAPTCP